MVKEFESISELVKDPIFFISVQGQIIDLIKKRASRSAPKPGYTYPRNWYDRMTDTGCLRAAYFTEHIEDIWNKRSRLGAEVRAVIKEVCDRAVVATHQAYQKIDAEETASAARVKPFAGKDIPWEKIGEDDWMATIPVSDGSRHVLRCEQMDVDSWWCAVYYSDKDIINLSGFKTEAQAKRRALVELNRYIRKAVA